VSSPEPAAPPSALAQSLDSEVLFERLPVGVAVLDRNLKLIRCNPTWLEFASKYSPVPVEEVKPGVGLFELYPGIEQNSIPHFERVLAGETLSARDFRLEARGMVAYWDVTVSPFIENGAIVGIIHIAADTTVRVQAQEKAREQQRLLAESEAELRALFAALTDLIFILDRDGRFVKVAPTNTSDMLGEPEKLLGRRIHDLMPAAEADPILEHIRVALETRETGTIQYSLTFDGIERWFSGSISPMLDDTIVWVSRDITERVRAYELLEERVEERTHELATLLEVSHRVGETLDLQPLLALVLEQLNKILDYTTATIFDIQEDWLCAIERRTNVDSRHVPLPKYPLRDIPIKRLVLDERRALMIDDIWDDSDVSAQFREPVDEEQLARLESAHTWLGVPLVVRDQVVGMLTVEHAGVAAFSEHEIALASAFADQAAVGIENARLFERSSRKVRELETIARIASTLTSEQPIVETLTAISREVVNATNALAASVTLIGAEPFQMRLLGQYGLPDGLPEALERVWSAGTPSALMRSYRDRRPEILRGQRAATMADERYASIHDVIRAQEWDPLAVVPVVYQGRQLGLLVACYRVGEEPNAEEMAFLGAIADQSAVAIENARLFAAADKRSSELQTLLAISNNIGSTLHMSELLGVILDQLDEVADHESCGVYLIDGDALVLTELRVWAESEPPAIGTRYPVSAFNVLWKTIADRQPVIIDNVRGDSPLALGYQQAVGDLLTTTFGFIRSWMGVPLMLKNEVIGMLTLTSSKVNHFTAHQSAVAMSLANQAAIAIDNARLLQRLEDRTRELSTVLEISNKVASTLELEPLLELILKELDAIAEHDGSGIYAVEGDELVALEARGPRPVEDRKGARRPLSQIGPLWEMAKNREHIIIDDVLDDSPIARDYRALVASESGDAPANVRSWMGVPMVVQDEVIGVLIMSSIRERNFSHAQAHLAQAVANQAATAITNARLYSEAAQRARESKALAEVAASAAFDEATSVILDRLAETVVQATDGVACAVTLINAATREVTLGGKYGDPIVDYAGVITEMWRAGDPSVTTVAFETRQPRVARQARAFAASNPLWSPIRDEMQRVDWDVAISVPLVHRGRAIGTLDCAYPEGYPATREQVAFLTTIADQAAVVVENARLFAQSEQQLHDMETLYKAGEELHRSLLVDEVVSALVDVAVDLVGAEKSVVFVWDASIERYVVRAQRGLKEDYRGRLSVAPGSGSIGRAAESGQAITVEDATIGSSVLRETVLGEGIRSYIQVPIKAAGRVFGVFNASYTCPRSFTPEERVLMLSLAQRAGVAIENAALFEQSQQLASLEERQRLARDLHDSVSQALYGIALGARTARTLIERDPGKAIDPLDYILALAEAGLAELRALIFELRPEALEREGLIAAIERQVAAVRARHGVTVEATLCPEPDVRAEVKEAVFRIIQEGMHNTVKHARASRISVGLLCSGDGIEAEISDNGVGFDASGEFPGHLGLRSMRERAANVGGTLEIASKPGEGATIRVLIPRTIPEVPEPL